jgi:Skp family chaperone for outer membrane proteins
MRLDPRASAVFAVILVGALAVRAGGQDKAAPGGRTAVLNVRECMDSARNQWVLEIQQEILKMQEADAGRATDLNPRNASGSNVKNLDHYNKRRLELYGAIVRIAGAVAKERGFDLVHRADPMPLAASADPELMAQIFARDPVYYDAAIDITNEVLERLNKEAAARKK